MALFGKGNTVDVLLVEDSLGDIRLTLEAFAEANPSVALQVAMDGEEAMAILRREGIHARAPRPDLILLDLNLPKIDGRQVLAGIKKDISLRLIPTIILTMSDDKMDILKCFELQANSYLCKPVDLDAFDKVVKSINDFWIARSRLPRLEQNGFLAQATL